MTKEKEKMVVLDLINCKTERNDNKGLYENRKRNYGSGVGLRRIGGIWQIFDGRMWGNCFAE